MTYNRKIYLEVLINIIGGFNLSKIYYSIVQCIFLRVIYIYIVIKTPLKCELRSSYSDLQKQHSPIYE